METLDRADEAQETPVTDEDMANEYAEVARREGLRMSSHGSKRATQRNVSPDALEYVMTYGRVVRRTGALFYFLGRRDLPRTDCHDERIARLVGTVVIVEGASVITLYRNPGALRDIKRKLKYRTRSFRGRCLAAS